jgi:hypothetical protein
MTNLHAKYEDDLKINIGHLMVMANLDAKYEDCGSKESLVIGLTSFCQVPCDLDL